MEKMMQDNEEYWKGWLMNINIPDKPYILEVTDDSKFSWIVPEGVNFPVIVEVIDESSKGIQDNKQGEL